MKIVIDKKLRQPIYRQIVEQVTGLTKCGLYREGDRLPTERELAEAYNIARGTVRRAYDKLAKNDVITVTQGKGTFIKDNRLNGDDAPPTIEIIDKYLDQLTGLSLSLGEIEIYIGQRLQELLGRQPVMQIAVVECCPESISEAMRSLAVFTWVDTCGFLLAEVVKKPQIILDGFSLIVVATAHADALLELAPAVKDKLVLVTFSLDNETLKDMASIPPGQKIGFFSQTKRHADIMTAQFALIDNSFETEGQFLASARKGFEEYLADKQVLVAPTCYQDFISLLQREAIARFTARGGKLIIFDYTLSIGSSMYVEERIRKYRIANYDLL